MQDVHWYQAGANEAGRTEKVELSLPAGVKLTRVSDTSLSDLLARGAIDCAPIARPPTCFLQGHSDIVRLFPDYWAMEEAYYRRTKVWPIMHIIAMQKHLLDEVRRGRTQSAQCVRRVRSGGASSACSIRQCPAIPSPGCPPTCAKCARCLTATRSHSGSRKTALPLRQFLRYTHEQGIAHRHAKPEEIFSKGIMTPVKV